MSLPSWLKRSVLQTAVSKHVGKPVEITQVESKPAVPVGDNYTSDMFRVTVRYRSENLTSSASLIVKCQAEAGPKQIMAEKIGLFEKETDIYENTLPHLTQILNGLKLHPDCLVSSLKPNGLLILEDLKPSGFLMAPRRDGLDLKHTQLVLKHIARMHASSVVLARKDTRVRSHSRGIFTNQSDNQVIQEFATFGLKSFVGAVSSWEGFEEIGKKMEAVDPNRLFVEAVDAGRASSIGFDVLNHGDLWINNMLFRYEGDTPVEIRFVDFQMCVWTTPCLDLHYFLHTSPSLEVYQNHLNLLLEGYHKELVGCLEGLGYRDVPSFGRFMDEYRERSLIGLLASVTVLPLVRAPQREDANFEDLMADDNAAGGIRQVAYNNESYRKMMEHFVREFDQLGLIQ